MAPRVLVPYREESRLAPYVEAIAGAGLIPEGVVTNGLVTLDGYDGLLLTGGTDVNPYRYGEEADRHTEEPDDERDTIELALIDQALKRNLPVFAICRGMQLLNVFYGGTLIQNLADMDRHGQRPQDKSLPAHAVSVEPGSLLAEITGAHTLEVNSRHHQAVGRLGAGLRVTARDSLDGTIEAMEPAENGFVLAVQWHPEDQVRTFPTQAKLFEGFAQAVQTSARRNET